MTTALSSPQVSVIIPSYNHERYIQKCVDSVLAQTYRDYEIIVVDDGSTDGTVDVLRTYGDAITLTEQPNRGTQAARNVAISQSSGSYLALLDSDDVWLPGKLERQMAVFHALPEVGLVYSLARTIDSMGRDVGKGAAFGVPVTEPGKAFSQLLLGDIIPALTAVFRKSCVDEVGLFDETLLGAGDWDLWLRIAARWRVVCVPEPLALYRSHEGNTTRLLLNNKVHCVEYRRVLEKASELSPREALDESIWRRARARSHLCTAEVEAISGNAATCGQELALALGLDSSLAYDEDSLVGRLVQWAHEYCGVDKRGAKYREFADVLFFELREASPTVSHLKRQVLSTAVMSMVFSSRGSDKPAMVRSLLPVGIASRPRWLLNYGVWSIMADAFMGAGLSGVLRKLLRMLCAMIL